jgi:hypothetical protein
MLCQLCIMRRDVGGVCGIQYSSSSCCAVSVVVAEGTAAANLPTANLTAANRVAASPAAAQSFES